MFPEHIEEDGAESTPPAAWGQTSVFVQFTAKVLMVWQRDREVVFLHTTWKKHKQKVILVSNVQRKVSEKGKTINE